MIVFTDLKLAFKYIVSDKINLLCFLLPLLIGLLLFSLLGLTIYQQASLFSTKILAGYHLDGFWGNLVMGLIKGLVLVLVYMTFNLFFVLLISLIASPFNQVMSQRIEKIHLKEDLNSLQGLWKDVSENFLANLFNELKKISFLLGISILAFLLSFFPIMSPITFILLTMCLAWEFLDFSWSRYDWKWMRCFKDLTSHFLTYGLAGFFFLLISNIPLINLLIPAWATSTFTLMWIKKNENSRLVTA